MKKGEKDREGARGRSKEKKRNHYVSYGSLA